VADPALIAKAATILKSGGLVAFPTETVYGLGADASSAPAVAKIFAAKGRPNDHPVIVHLASADQIREWAVDIPEEAWTLAHKFWPGPMTLILKRAPRVLDAVTGGQDTVGLRVPSHPFAHALLAAFGGGVAAPSANKFGRVSPTTAQHVKDEFGDTLDLVIDGGASEVGIESTIIDCSSGCVKILRPGAITGKMLADAWGPEYAAVVEQFEATRKRIKEIEPAALLRLGSSKARKETEVPRVSGSLDAHYAPRTRLQLVAANQIAATLAAHGHSDVVLLSRAKPAAPFAGLWQQAASDPATYARELYAHLRMLDTAGADLMLIEAPPPGPEWEGVNDRLRRAAFGSGGQ
jgi:L-threonylcarbamoyladenylate synthase